MSLLTLAEVLPWSIVALGCGLGYLFVRQSRRIVETLESMERDFDGLQDQLEDLIPDEAEGLSPGEEAPAFALPDLGGRPVSLEQLGGRRVLLVFFSPTCPYCREMAPDLGKLPWEGAGGRPLPVVITTGDPEANRALVAEHGILCPVLLDEKNDIAMLYEAAGTPAAYLIDERGLIVKPRADGRPAVLMLAEEPASAVEAARQHEAGPASGNGPPVGGGAVATAVAGPSQTSAAAGAREIRVPIIPIPEEGIGVGDLVRRVTDVLRIKPCRGCEKRRQAWNRWRIRGRP